MKNFYLKKLFKEINSSSLNEEELIFFENQLLSLIYQKYRKKIVIRFFVLLFFNILLFFVFFNFLIVGFLNLKESNFFYLIKILFLDFKEILSNYESFLFAILENLSFLFFVSFLFLILNIFIVFLLVKKIINLFKVNGHYFNLKNI